MTFGGFNISVKNTTLFRLLFVLYCVSACGVASAEDYYMRFDGKASSKSEATSCASADTAMSVETHNEEKFLPGDVINLCDSGGVYKTSIVAPSSGSDGKPITYKNADGSKPTIDLSVNVGSSAWEPVGDGVYTKKGFGRVLWEDSVPLKAASSESCSNGNWYYPIGSGKLYYKPTSGNPANHSIRTMWFDVDWSPYAIDLRNKSNITLYGVTINRVGGGIGHGQKKTMPVYPIKNIIIHSNKITRCMWGIWSQVFSGVESDVQIHSNHIENCNSGISSWTGSDTTPGHTQHHKSYSITTNSILKLNSISDNMMWSDALLKSHYYTDHEGISFQDVQDSLIEDNTITTIFKKDMTSDHYWSRAIYLYLTNGDVPTSGNSILRNYISGHFYPAIYISTAKEYEGFENNSIAYNVIYYGLGDKGQISFGVTAKSDNKLTGNNYFVNNTVVNSSKGVGIYMPKGMTGNWIFRNNIVQAEKLIMVSGNNNIGNLKFDHNMYKGGTWGYQVGNYARTFSGWQSKSNYDTVGSSEADPLFVSKDDANFNLVSLSPAIDAGLDVGFVSDHEGNSVTGNPDIGAYEYITVVNSNSVSANTTSSTDINSGKSDTIQNKKGLYLKNER